MQCHLSPPEGTRSDVRRVESSFLQLGVQLLAKKNSFQVLEDESEEIDETTEDDRIRYKDQLTIIGMIGRRALEPNILILIR